MTTQMSCVAPQERSGRTFAVSLGASFTVIAVVILVLLAIGAPTADATTYTVTNGASAFNWSDTTRWNPSGVPGTGDTAIVNLGTTITMDTNANGVNLQLTSSGTQIIVPGGTTLMLEPSSLLTSSNTITVAGGTLAFDTGTTNSSTNVVHNTGTVNLVGNLFMVAGGGTYTWNGGQITGSGTLKNPGSTTLSVTGSQGGMTISGATIDNFGTLDYTSSSGQSLSVSNGAHLKIESGATLQLNGTDPIQSNLTSSPAIDVLSGGTLQKTGTSTTTVGVPTNIAGTINPGSGVIVLAEGGSHSGTFNLSGSTGIVGFNSTSTVHNIVSGASVTGLGHLKVMGGNFNVLANPFVVPFFDQTGGTIGGTGYLKVTTALGWTGGSQNSAGTTELASAAMATLNGSSLITLDGGRQFLNNGTLNYAPTTGFLTITNGSKVTNNSTFDLQNDTQIAGTTGGIDNVGSGSLKKSGGTLTSITCPVNFSSTSSIVPNASGTIRLSGGGSWGGGSPVTLDLTQAGSTIQLAGGTFTFNAGSGGMVATGSGKLLLSNTATLFMNSGPLTITNFEQDDTSIFRSTISGGVSINGTYLWTGGNINGNAISANLVTINGSAVMNMTGTTAPMTLDNTGTITNAGGTLNYSSSVNGLALDNGGKILNTAGPFNYASALGITSNSPSTGALTFTGGSLIRIGTGTPQVNCRVNVSGSGALTTNGGSIRFAEGGTSSLAINPIQATDRIEIGGGSSVYTMNNGTSVSGSGKIAVVSGGSLNLTALLSIPNLEVNNGGLMTLTASGALHVTTSMNWTGGTISGPGVVQIDSGTVTATSLAGPPTLADGLTFINLGTFNYNPTQSLTFKNSGGGGVTFTNGAVFDIQGNGSTAAIGSGHSFSVVSGTVKKTVGAGAFLFNVPYNQSGGITDAQIANGQIGITGGGSLAAGTMQGSGANATIDFNSTPAFTITGGTLAGQMALKGGTLSVNAATTAPFSFLQTAGTLDGASSLTIPASSTYTLTGGSLIPPLTQIALNGVLALNTTVNTVTVGQLDVQSGGTVNWTGTSAVLTQGPITNAGTFDLRGSGAFGSSGSFNNVSGGTLKKTTSSGGASMGLQVTITGGTLSTQLGTLFLTNAASVTHSGQFDVQAGSGLQFSNGNHTFAAGSSFSAGTGTVFVANPAVLNLATNQTIPTLQLGGGQITGTGNLQTTSSFSWTGGTMDGTGTTTITSGTFSMTTGPMTLGRNLTIPGNSVLNGSLTVVNAITITNGGTFDVQGSTVTCGCAATFANNGTLQASSGGVTFPIPVTGSGTLSVTGGATFGGLAAQSYSVAAIDHGQAQFSGNPVTIGSITNGGSFPGTLSVTGGATTVAGTVSLGASSGSIAIYAGTLTLNGTTSAVNFALNAGTVNGSGAVTASSSFVFNAGSLAGSGSFTSGGTGSLTGSGGAMTLSKPFVNNGTMTYAPTLPSNILTVLANTAMTNNGTFTFGGQNLAASGSPVATFTNNNTFYASPTGTLNFGPVFANANQVTLTSGTTIFTNGYSQTGPMTYMNGGNIGSPLGVNINGGSMEAIGTVVGDLLINGTLTVEDAVSNPAALTVTGNYTQTSSGLLNIKLNGTGAGTTYDQLNVTGNVNLAGTLTVTLGYSPVNGDTYKPLTFGGRPGGTDFTTKNIPPIPGGGSFSNTYVAGPPQALQIVANTTSADLSVTQSGPSSALQGQNVTITLTVANAGPSAAAVNFSDTFSGSATFVSATASGGGACTGTGPVSCSWTSIVSGASQTVTLVLNANAAGVITNNASVTSSTTPDPNTGNNAAPSLSITVGTSSDVSVAKSGPASATASSQITYTLTVINNGPSPASGVSLTDPTPSGTTLISVTGACASFPCSLGTMSNGASASVQATYSLNAGTTSVTNVASVTTSSSDPNLSNNNATASTTVGCPSAPGGQLPGNGTTGIPVNGTFFWTNAGAAQYKVYLGPQGSGCQTLAGTTSNTSFPYAGLQPATTYEWRVEGVSPSCPVVTSSCFTFTTAPSCAQPPAPNAPASGATVSSPIAFSWTGVPGAVDYHLFASVAGGSSTDRGTTTGTSLTLSLGDGLVVWFVVANVPGCGQLQSASSSFTACTDLPAPVAEVVADASSGQSYDVTWEAVPLASKYEIDESPNAAFTGVSTKTVTTNSATYQHTVGAATAFFYRVRAFGGCKQQFGPDSNVARVVLVPVVSVNPGQNANANVPVGSKLKVVQNLFIPGFPEGTFPYTATVDKPWLTVQPASGALPPGGITLQVLADPTDLPNGTFTGTVTLTIGGGSGAKAANVTSNVNVPVSISLVTPVKPGSSVAPPANALVIPSVGHLDGVDSKWQSDVRITNPNAVKQSYTLTFTPDDPAKGVKSTTITVAANDTTALDDIVRNWYGVGTLGDSANGVLLIIPASSSGSGKGPVDNVSVQTAVVASSRTYNVTSNGTLGQYIPAIPFASFIGKAAASLSLQQVAQNADFRTNLGLVEAAGSSATALVSVFSNDGAKLLEQSISLKANEQKQLNSFLAAAGITLDDGRIEVKVTDGNGKITAYASRVDNKTGDPLLVSGVSTAQAQANHFILPGVAAINNGLANWRSDVRIYNGGGAPQAATLTFYPLNGVGAPLANSLLLAAGEVKSLDDIVKSYFSLDNGGGALHVTTAGDSPLVVTGRTYNLTDHGSYGQFIPAVTPNDGVGKGERSLNVLQVEDSVRYRTNLGLAEVTGKPVTVEVSVFLPDSKVIPRITLDLGPNEYRQTAILHDLGLPNTYNARISVRVVDGEGKITAYGSVVDMETQDPTYVPAQ